MTDDTYWKVLHFSLNTQNRQIAEALIQVAGWRVEKRGVGRSRAVLGAYWCLYYQHRPTFLCYSDNDDHDSDAFLADTKVWGRKK